MILVSGLTTVYESEWRKWPTFVCAPVFFGYRAERSHGSGSNAARLNDAQHVD